MGLKKNNHKINGYVYPEVYAVFNGNIEKLGNLYQVSFNVHATRELAINETPLEVKKVMLDWDRKSDIVAAAYAKGKEQKEVKRGGNTVLVDGTFTGWDNDIV